MKPVLLTESEAVARAEDFIRANGYVRAEDADLKRFRVESLTYGSTPEKLLPHRVGTLLPKACGVIPEPLRTFDQGWSVLFCYDPSHPMWHGPDLQWNQSVRGRSRVVIMNTDGTNMFVAHQDISLEASKSKALQGQDDFERAYQVAAQQGVAADGAAPRR